LTRRISVHRPRGRIEEETLLTFEAALRALPCQAYDRERWLYVPPFYAEYRYVLGTLGEKPLICVGLNPSTAAPEALDNTLKSVWRVAEHNGFDSFQMMNLYAQRATRPGDMDREACDFLRRENARAFRFLLGRAKTVWAAWGAVMETRGYLRDCLEDFLRVGEEMGAGWFTAGERSRKGHPHHPLYLRSDSGLTAFDIGAYIAALRG
jgi:hypothetical protein